MMLVRFVFVVAVLLPALATAQTPPPSTPRLTLPTVVVTAQKEPADPRTLPVSVTAVPSETLWDAKVSFVSDAAMYSPNTWFVDFTARKLSNAFMRGIGSSPANPGITTYIDGVPQLNTNSSNIELTGTQQVEFVRGSQSTLFGRNTLGGVINVSSERPSLSDWSGNAFVPFGNFSTREVRGAMSGPLSSRVGLAVSGGYSARDGFTVNDLTGNDVDFRSATFGKAQLLWTPSGTWETRVIASGERARDGDYALNDLGALRANPFHVARDFEGHTDRDVFNTTVLTRREGSRVALSTTTGFVRWKTEDLTDLDYSPLPLARRNNAEEDFQFTQEVRLASAAAAPVTLSSNASLKWQTGVFFFTQNYEQDAVNNLAPFLLSPMIAFPLEQHSPRSALDDVGVSVYGQGTVTLDAKLDVIVGARLDHERKQAMLETFFVPAIAPALTVDIEESFSNVSPQLALTYRFQPDRMLYASAARGFKAGGFNPASPPGNESYGEEHTWNIEGGVKASWAGGRVSLSAAAYFIDWTDLQLNLPNPFVPAQFFIANVGGATSRGIELELNARPVQGVDVFGGLGYTRARFDDGSTSGGVDVSGNELPNTPDYTVILGSQLSRAVSSRVTLYGRGEVVSYGAFHYDDANTASQEAYALANFRVGARGRLVFAEAWVKNAFDTRYIPIALAYPGFAPSGFIGESGRPRTFGFSAGLMF